MWNVSVQKLAGPEKGSLFRCECAGRICSFVVDQVFTAIQLVCPAGDVVLRALVGTAAYGVGWRVAAAALAAWSQSEVAGELRQLH
ncbi:hypothetical protein B7P43_G05109 [Cryptotermes secundus]|uniref:Uncharacterized protein n=1 Tax=Cryptotermes secundus TaxID=105785 RepID=A0A2J7PY02_9NEOP|nr:hypothetical protein B7P43_G05109 [Cryptotermes secundus]